MKNAIHTALRLTTLLLAAASLCLATATRAQDVEAATGQLRIDSNPAGALVTCDGVPRDTTPITLTLHPGKHIIRAAKHGHFDAVRTVTLSAGQKLALPITLDPIHGLVLIHSEPEGAQVQIDGADRGPTPLLITDLPLGQYRAQFSQPGYVDSEIELSIKDRTPLRLFRELQSDSARVTLTSEPSGARVFLNGVTAGTTPCVLERVPGGQNAFRFENDGCHPYEQNLHLVAGETHTINAMLDPIPSELKIVSMPTGARIYINNQFHGEAPVVLRDVAPQVYRIRAELPAYETVARNVTVNRATTIVEEFRMTRNSGQLEIVTQPAGAKVFIDGKDMGETLAPEGQTDSVSDPFLIPMLSPGKHDVLVTKKGFHDATSVITVERDKTTTRHERLKRRFIESYEVVTYTATYRGVLVDITPDGSIRIETRPGIIKTVRPNDVRRHGPLRTDE